MRRYWIGEGAAAAAMVLDGSSSARTAMGTLEASVKIIQVASECRIAPGFVGNFELRRRSVTGPNLLRSRGLTGEIRGPSWQLFGLRWCVASRHRSESDTRSVTVGEVLPAAPTGGMMIESVRGVNTRCELAVMDGASWRRVGRAINRERSIESRASTTPIAEAWAISSAAVGYAIAAAAIMMIAKTNIEGLVRTGK